MKRNSFFLLLLLPLILMNCNLNDNLTKYELKSLDATIKLPLHYKFVNKSDIQRIISNEKDLKLKNELLNFWKTNPNYEVLIDTLNPYKFITILEIKPYVLIDTTILHLIVDHERNLSSLDRNVIDSTYYVGSNIGNIENLKFIESTYSNIDYDGSKRIGSTFMISSEVKTIGISFYSPQEENTVLYINTIKKK